MLYDKIENIPDVTEKYGYLAIRNVRRDPADKRVTLPGYIPDERVYPETYICNMYDENDLDSAKSVWEIQDMALAVIRPDSYRSVKFLHPITEMIFFLDEYDLSDLVKFIKAVREKLLNESQNKPE